MEKTLKTQLATIETSIGQTEGRIDELASASSSIHSLVTDMAKAATSVPSPELLRPLAKSLGEEIAKLAISEFQSEKGELTRLASGINASQVALQLTLDRTDAVILEAQAALQGKVVEGGVLRDKTFFEKAKGIAVPVAIVATGTLVGIAAWEGGRAFKGWASSEDEDVIDV